MYFITDFLMSRLSRTILILSHSQKHKFIPLILIFVAFGIQPWPLAGWQHGINMYLKKTCILFGAEVKNRYAQLPLVLL
jgi:hypothetical protein